MNIESVKSYIDSNSRNKIVISKHQIFDIEFLNIGRELSHEIKLLKDEHRLAIKSFLLLDELLLSSIKENDFFGKFLAIENLSILFEPELKTDFAQILEKYSSLNTLFVKWDGEIEDGILYFLTKEKGQKIDIKNLSHIIL